MRTVEEPSDLAHAVGSFIAQLRPHGRQVFARLGEDRFDLGLLLVGGGHFDTPLDAVEGSFRRPRRRWSQAIRRRLAGSTAVVGCDQHCEQRDRDGLCLVSEFSLRSLIVLPSLQRHRRRNCPPAVVCRKTLGFDAKLHAAIFAAHQ
jgi:hypothetical protein